MANEVNNTAEESKSGETSASEQAPEQKTEQAAAETTNTTPAPTPAPATAPRTVPKPAAPFAPPPAPTPPAAAAADEPQSGEVDFGAILEQFEQEQTAYHPGDLVEGKVVGVSDRGALIDFGYKSEGVIAAEELAASPEALSVGDTVEVVIKSLPAGDAPPSLSRADARLRKVWNDIEEAYKNEQPVVGKIVDKTKGGLRVDL